MELLYVWVENLQEGLIKGQGFNFDNRFKYQLKQDGNGIFELSIKSNPNYLEDFFQLKEQPSKSLANIRNITAIVGQNGAGKSSVVDFLKENFGTGESGSREENEEESEGYLYILREYKNKRMEHYICFSKEMKVKIKMENDTSFYYEMRIGSDLPRNLKETTLIYFSNVYDNKEEYISENMLNISTNYLSSSNFYMYGLDYGLDLIEGEDSTFKFQEVKRQIHFIQAVNNDLKQFELPFKVPDQIDITFRTRDHFPGRFSYETNDKTDVIKSIREIGARKINQLQIPHDGIERKVIIDFTKCILQHLLRELNERRISRRVLKIPFKFFQDRNDYNYQNDFIRLIREIRRFARIIRKKNEELSQLADMLKSLTLFMLMFYKSYRHRVTLVGRKNYKMSFNLEELSGGELETFVDLYENSYITDDFMMFSWKDLSSGQKALLNIYSRFHFVSKRWELTRNPKNDLIIFIDEGEVYLHPHWQGKFLNSLIEYFPVVFRNSDAMKQRNIQLILTSNSPFIVSDLPSTNVIFLKKDGENTIIIDDLEEYHQTFAANIHSLLAHSFFMEDGVTGAFAKRKINEIAHLLVKEDINKILQNEKKIERTINLIGEPLIRNKLSQMLKDRLSTRMINVNNEIKNLKSRIVELENWKNDNN
ncbi:AAA family ATPase [Bacillus cereus group sp. BfR-BA-01350]|uniref:AAA family ATPase n=1 Tax=Bacillus cereus group sp. BfR-BA-01350 TaxID=2920313 RepID=UPI001F581C37|nr:AAA family ATPase [Bacillus cereus group sp. BfR-BA-01350]